MAFSLRLHGPLLLVASLAPLAAQSLPGTVVAVDKVVVEGKLLTDSPATVSLLDLKDQPLTANSMAGLANRAANFFVSTNDAHSFNDTFALRGLTNTPIFGDPAVSFYLDDLPLGSGFTFPSDLAGFTAAELHRGPSQNTVFGRAGSAGVITLTTPEPASVASAEVRASYGNYDARNASASVSSAAGGSADAYVNAAYFARDGYVTNTRLNRDIDNKDSLSGLARFRFRPTATSEFSLLVTAFRVRDGVQPLVPLGGPLFTVSRSAEGLTDLDATNAALKGAFTTPVGLLSLTTSLNNWELGPYSNVLALGPSELTNGVTQKQRNWNEEVKLVSDVKANVRWQVGAFYSDGRTDGAFTRNFGPFIYEQSVYHLDAHDAALFGESTWKASEALHFTAGLRVEDSRKAMDRHEAVPIPQIFDLERESTALLPKFAANFAVDHDTSIFASLGAGFKPGGFSAFTGNRALSAFGPERTKTIEAGVTQSTPDQRLTTTFRAFWYDITGYQIERSFATSAATDDYLVVNAPRARSFGGELEISWKPVTGLTVSADLGTTNVTLREFHDPFTGTSYSGNRAPYVPTYDASLQADYQTTRGWFAGVALSSNGRTYYTEAENLSFGQTAYALLDAHLGYTVGGYRVSIYGANLTDQGYYSAITPGTGHGTPGAPRTYGLELRAQW